MITEFLLCRLVIASWVVVYDGLNGLIISASELNDWTAMVDSNTIATSTSDV